MCQKTKLQRFDGQRACVHVAVSQQICDKINRFFIFIGMLFQVYGIKLKNSKKDFCDIITSVLLLAKQTFSSIIRCLSFAFFAVSLIIFAVCPSLSFFTHRCPGTRVHTSIGKWTTFLPLPAFKHGRFGNLKFWKANIIAKKLLKYY